MLFRLLLCIAVISTSLIGAEVVEVRAESFGFNETDATRALQAAINSKATRVIVGNTGKPWIVRPIKLRSDLELVFEKGVEVQALRGDFQQTNASLFSAKNASHITIRGEGNVLRMWKADYQRPPYEKGEWRHSLGFHGCEDVTIANLTLADSGGDGIYLGTGANGGCRRFVIRDVQCLSHHRQGISVINAEDLTIERCSFNDTSGTAPMAGIDFEPNAVGERLKNCVLRHCNFERNASGGVLFALGKLDASSEPISITLEDCTVRGNEKAMHLAPRNPAGVRGSITFTRCVFADSPKQGVLIDRKTLPGARVTFERCEFSNLATASKDSAPIAISCRGEQGDPLGGIVFKDCTIVDTLDRRLIVYDDLNGVRLKEITGTLIVKQAGTTKTIELTQKLIDEWFPWSADLRSYPRIDLQAAMLKPAFPDSGKLMVPFSGWLRGESSFAIVAAKSGEPLQFNVTTKMVGKKARQTPSPVKIIAPSGKVTKLADAPLNVTTAYDFKSEEAGVHRIVIHSGSHIASCNGTTLPVNALSLSGAFHFVGTAGPLCFGVPAGVKEFAIRVAGDGGLEQARAIVTDAHGKIVVDEDNITRTRQFVLTREDAAKPETWSLRLAQPKGAVIEDVHVLLDGVPSVFAASPESLLVPVTAP